VGAIRQLTANPALRETLGRSGRRYIVEKYSRQRSAGTYITLLQEILQQLEGRSRAAAEI